MRIDLPEDRPRLTVSMADGAVLTLSPLLPEDRPLLEEGLERMSVESRYTRFGQGLSSLSDAELDYLSNVDQRAHVAWGASVDGESAAVGRYICLAESGTAEIAITVLDEFQGRGVGAVLLHALAGVARADGLESFRLEMVPGNIPMERITRGIDVSLDESEGLVVGSLPVADVPLHPQEEEMVEVMAAVRAILESG